MTFVELPCLRGLPPAGKRWLSADHYAFPRSRSAEILLSDLDHCVATDARSHRIPDGVKLHIAAERDSVSNLGRMETIRFFWPPIPPCRYIGV